MHDSPQKVILTKNARVFLRDDGILQIEIKHDTYFEVDDADELIDAAKEIGGGKRFLNLIFPGKGTLLDSAARKYSSSEDGSIFKLADAFVISSLAQRLIANFIIKAEKPAVPTAFFLNEKDAIAWLKSL